MNVICIIQARMGSTRLPEKILRIICGKTVLEHCIDRVKKVNCIDKIVIATTSLQMDDIIVQEATRLRVECFRGDENDVLSRYYYAAQKYNADIIVRITSDCPLIDTQITEDIIQFYLNNYEKYDYVSNTIDRTYPRGLDTEVFSFKVLEKAFKEAHSLIDREHVTPYIWRNPSLFRLEQYKNNVNYSNLRWTLDTIEDFQLIKRIYDILYPIKNNEFSMIDVLNLYNKYPELKKINANIEQKKL